MILMRVGYLALEGLLGWLAAYCGSPEAMALAGVMLLIPLLSLTGNLYLRNHLEIRLDGVVSLRKGDTGAVTVTVDNPTPVPGMRICCRVAVHNQLNRESREERIWLWAGAKKKGKARLKISSEYCGRLRVTAEQVVLYDCLGLLGVKCPCPKGIHITVQPDTFAVEVSLAPCPDRQDDSERYSGERPGADLTETYQLREYVPGDSPRQIHWKLSGKLDRLVVRDPALPLTRDVLVFWERTGDTGNFHRIDAQAEVAVSVCRGLMDQGIPFALGWNDTDRNLCVVREIRDMEELVGIIPRLLRATGTPSGVSGAALLMQTRPEALCGHMVYLAERPQPEAEELKSFGYVTMLVCGGEDAEQRITFDPEDYPQKLGQITI